MVVPNSKTVHPKVYCKMLYTVLKYDFHFPSVVISSDYPESTNIHDTEASYGCGEIRFKIKVAQSRTIS